MSRAIIKPTFSICENNGAELIDSTFEPPHDKTNNLHMRKQKRKSALWIPRS